MGIQTKSKRAVSIAVLVVLSLLFCAGALAIDAATQQDLASCAYAKKAKKVKLSAKTLKVSGYKATYYYTGKAVKPKVTVVYRSRQLKKNRDYKLSYKANKAAGTARIVIKGKGAYKGTVTKKFKIRYNLAKHGFASVPYAAYLHQNGKAITPNPSVLYKNKLLSKGKDYTLVYKNNTRLGNAKVTAKGRGLYAGSVSVAFKIASDLSENLEVKLMSTSYRYTGQAHVPSVVVTHKEPDATTGKDVNVELVQGSDYSLSVKNSSNIGTATLTVTGKGRYKGMKTVRHFSILQPSDTIIDVSYWNGTIDWGRVAPQVSTVFMRAFRVSSKHTSYADRAKSNMMIQDLKYDSYATSCDKLKLPYSAYAYIIYTNATDTEKDALADARYQADRFWDAAFSNNHKPVTLILDIESSMMSKKNAAKVVACTEATIDRLQQRAASAGVGHVKVGLYIANHLYNMFGFASTAGTALLANKADFVWVPSYGKNTGSVPASTYRPKHPYDIWQYSSKGSLPSVAGGFDVSLVNANGPNKRSITWYLQR